MTVLYFFLIAYFIMIGFLIYGFSKIKNFDVVDAIPTTKFSIIIPFRNENENLPQLLNSISMLDYPTTSLEVILVDDASDLKFQIPNYDFKISMLENSRVSTSPKKDAILTAIQMVSNEWIVTTDADCVVHPKWLLTLDSFIQNKNPEMIVGAVTYSKMNSFLYYFQQLDLASLQGTTIGSFGLKRGFLCNGANFAYTKKFFFELKGFDGNDKIASGDDVFLLQKAITRSPEKVLYLKSANNIITTNPEKSWSDLFSQRVRWASKTKNYESIFGKFLGLIVFTGNLSWLMIFAWVLADWRWFSIFVCAFKFGIDAVLLIQTQKFLKFDLKYVLLSSFLYPFFSVSVAIYSFFGKYEWKERSF